jgi:uncharacterized protein YbaR (Trm112 family)
VRTPALAASKLPGLTESVRDLDCKSCGRSYPAVGPVPLLLEEAAEASA